MSPLELYICTHYFQIGAGAVLGGWLLSRKIPGGIPLGGYIALLILWPALIMGLLVAVIAGLGFTVYKVFSIKIPPPPTLTPPTREPKLGLEPVPALPPGKSRVPRPGEE